MPATGTVHYKSAAGSAALGLPAFQPRKSDRLHLIAERAREQRMQRSASQRVREVEQLLCLETRARLEAVSLALQIRRAHVDPDAPRSARRATLSLLLATMLSAREQLARHAEHGGAAGDPSGGVSDTLYNLECQAEALYLVAARL